MGETRKKLWLFGGSIEIVLYDLDEGMGSLVIDGAYALGKKLERVFNLYDPTSELSTLNRKRTLKPSKTLLEVLSLALEFCRLSDGEYDISLGRVYLSQKQGNKVIPACSFKDIQIKNWMVTLLNEDVLIDLGSIAKGFIAQRMAEHIKAQGVVSGLIDARGDIVAFGRNQEVFIQHPRDQNKIMCSIMVAGKGVATSGDYNQYHGTYENSHILKRTDIISASAVADDLTYADLFATLLMVCSEKSRERIMKARLNIQAMIINKSLKTEYINGFEGLVVK